jgi:hypothetical protein
MFITESVVARYKNFVTFITKSVVTHYKTSLQSRSLCTTKLCYVHYKVNCYSSQSFVMKVGNPLQHKINFLAHNIILHSHKPLKHQLPLLYISHSKVPIANRPISNRPIRKVHKHFTPDISHSRSLQTKSQSRNKQNHSLINNGLGQVSLGQVVKDLMEFRIHFWSYNNFKSVLS